MNRVRGAATDKPDLMDIMGDVEGEAEPDGDSEDSQEEEEDSGPEVSTLVPFDRPHRPWAAATNPGPLHISFSSRSLLPPLTLLLSAPLHRSLPLTFAGLQVV